MSETKTNLIPVFVIGRACDDGDGRTDTWLEEEADSEYAKDRDGMGPYYRVGDVEALVASIQEHLAEIQEKHAELKVSALRVASAFNLTAWPASEGAQQGLSNAIAALRRLVEFRS